VLTIETLKASSVMSAEHGEGGLVGADEEEDEREEEGEEEGKGALPARSATATSSSTDVYPWSTLQSLRVISDVEAFLSALVARGARVRLLFTAAGDAPARGGTFAAQRRLLRTALRIHLLAHTDIAVDDHGWEREAPRRRSGSAPAAGATPAAASGVGAAAAASGVGAAAAPPRASAHALRARVGSEA
jgi:hypothetical protein